MPAIDQLGLYGLFDLAPSPTVGKWLKAMQGENSHPNNVFIVNGNESFHCVDIVGGDN